MVGWLFFPSPFYTYRKVFFYYFISCITMLIYQNCFSFLSLNHNMHVCYLRRSLFDILWVSCFFFGPTLILLASWKDLDYCFAISVPFFPSFFFFIIWRVSLFKNSLTLRKHLQYKFWYLDNRYAIFRKIGIAFWQWKEKSTAVHIDIDIVYVCDMRDVGFA